MRDRRSRQPTRLVQVDFRQTCGVHEVEPRPVWAGSNDVLHVVPVSRETGEPVPGRLILPAPNAEHAQIVVSKKLTFARPSPDPLVTPDHDETLACDDWHPFRVQDALRA